MEGDVIALFEFQDSDAGITMSADYRLVPPDGVTERDLEGYAHDSDDGP